MEILAGLTSTPIFRLHKTWKAVDRKLRAAFEDVRELMSQTGSCKNYRETIHSVQPPLVPYIGVYLTDLTFVEDANPNFLPPPHDSYINFQKRRLTASVIQEVEQYQQTPYNLQVIEKLDIFISTGTVVCDVVLQTRVRVRVGVGGCVTGWA
jgi:son of sevenless